MSSSIPTSTSVVESTVIKAPLAQVWHLIKLQSFANFWSTLSKSEVVSSTSDEADVFKWTFKDGSVYEVKQEEHSSIGHFITYSVITAQPELTYTSILSTIKCLPVTSGAHANSTYVEWSANFSSDATVEVIQDAKYKRVEALADLEKATTKEA